MKKSIKKTTDAKGISRSPRSRKLPEPMTFDEFAAVAQPGACVVVYDVLLVDVQSTTAGGVLLTIEHAGKAYRLVGEERWYHTYGRSHVGKMGCIKPVAARPHKQETGACEFTRYIDQSLRRAPELDIARHASKDGSFPPVLGWRHDGHQDGFLAPFDFVPGYTGRFVPDETVALTLRVPPEFLLQCKRLDLTPETVLRTFIGDVCGIQTSYQEPRADGYGRKRDLATELTADWLYIMRR